MKKNFRAGLARVLAHEGGYVDHPLDPGGATNFGITRRTLAAWRGIRPWRKLPKSEVRALKRREVAQIYRARYWDAVSGDKLPSGVDYAVFDYAVNSGVARAAKALQRVAGARADGIVGPLTLAAVARHHPKTIIRRLIARRRSFLQRLRTWKTFGRGWTARVNGVLADALEMEKEQMT
ncbi:putative Peptidoglycan domain protein [bacterium BMS3Bbin10]|nr:putative Peptidoglycan domain protein [bacterium BMS3Bbin10]